MYIDIMEQPDTPQVKI